MFRNILISAFGAALGVCLALAAVQFFTTVPLILKAEVFERAGTAHPQDTAAPAAAHDHTAAPAAAHDHAATAEWEPADGLERSAYTLLADFVLALGTAAMLIGGMALAGVRIDARTGVVWGFGGFLAASLLPSLGL